MESKNCFLEARTTSKDAANNNKVGLRIKAKRDELPHTIEWRAGQILSGLHIDILGPISPQRCVSMLRNRRLEVRPQGSLILGRHLCFPPVANRHRSGACVARFFCPIRSKTSGTMDTESAHFLQPKQKLQTLTLPKSAQDRNLGPLKTPQRT